MRICFSGACLDTTIVRKMRLLNELLPSYTLITSTETRNDQLKDVIGKKEKLVIPSSFSSFSFVLSPFAGACGCWPYSSESLYLAVSPLLNSSDILLATIRRKKKGS